MARPRKNAVKDQSSLLTPDNVVEIPVEEQPYPLPEGWKWVRLSSFADCLDKFRKPINADERAVREGTIPYYGATGQVGWIDDYLTNEHLVLIGEDGAPFFDILKNKSYIIEGKSWVNNHAHILRSFFGKNGNIYLMHYLNIFNYTGYVNGTTRLKLTQKSLNAIPIPLPPLDEQQRIVDIIESLFAKLDDAREKAEAVLDGFERRKAAILHKAFTGELTAKWREENGEVFNSWEKTVLGKIIKVFSGKSLTSKNMDPSGRIPVYGGNGITGYHNKCNVSKDTIVIGRVGYYCGSVHYIKEDAWVTDNALIVSFDKNKFESFFIFYLLLYTDLRQNDSSTAQPVISGSKIYPIEASIATLSEQQEVVRILDTLLEKERQVKEAAEEVLERIDLMKKSILAKAFRGELSK